MIARAGSGQGKALEEEPRAFETKDHMGDLATNPVKAGDLIAGKYRVERVLGAGGMGFVVAARHADLEDLYAIKILRGDLAKDASALKRFLKEAQAARRLKDENVVQVYDVGRMEDGTPYIVMEYLDGLDLAKVVREHGPTPVKEAVHWVTQACEAVAAAHAQGIFHRDLKPANLFLTTRANGSPCIKVLDFGIAKIVEPRGTEREPPSTTDPAPFGSPPYMAPERMRGQVSADPRIDVWSLGVILYELLVGRPPFWAESPADRMALALREAPVPLSSLRPDVPPGLEKVILRCLEKDPDDRLLSVAALSAGIAEFGPPVKPAGGLERFAAAADEVTNVVANKPIPWTVTIASIRQGAGSDEPSPSAPVEAPKPPPPVAKPGAVSPPKPPPPPAAKREAVSPPKPPPPPAAKAEAVSQPKPPSPPPAAKAEAVSQPNPVPPTVATAKVTLEPAGPRQSRRTLLLAGAAACGIVLVSALLFLARERPGTDDHAQANTGAPKTSSAIEPETSAAPLAASAPPSAAQVENTAPAGAASETAGGTDGIHGLDAGLADTAASAATPAPGAPSASASGAPSARGLPFPAPSGKAPKFRPRPKEIF